MNNLLLNTMTGSEVWAMLSPEQKRAIAAIIGENAQVSETIQRTRERETWVARADQLLSGDSSAGTEGRDTLYELGTKAADDMQL